MIRPSKWAFITGASKGIGKATAELLAAKGYGVILIARKEDALRKAAEHIADQGGAVHRIKADITAPEDVQRIKREIESHNFPLTLLALNAGIARIGKVLEMPLAEWRSVMEVNVLAQVALLQALFPLLAKPAHIVFVNSVAGKTVFPDWGAYAASKFALRALADTLRMEVADQNIKVTSVFPSSTDTSLHDALGLNWDRSKMLKPEEVARAIVSALDFDGDTSVEEIHLGNVKGLF